MKFLRVLIILLAITLTLNKRVTRRYHSDSKHKAKTVIIQNENPCSITLMDNDSQHTQNNAQFYGDTNQPRLACDLSRDLSGVMFLNHLDKNTFQNVCKYELIACTGENYKDCKTFTGTVKPGNIAILNKPSITKMKSFKVKNALQQIPKNNQCEVILADNDSGFFGTNQHVTVGSGQGSKASFISDIDNDVLAVATHNKSKTHHCTCKITTFNDANFKGSSYTNTLAMKPNSRGLWMEKRNELWKDYMSSIKWDCTNLASPLKDYFDQ